MKKKERNLALIIFLLGIFIGAMDTGIVSPARTVIAESFGISANLSVWIVTIYTLAYAVAMPIAGKISDRYGKKKIYTLSITIFGIGSILCGLANYLNSFNFLLIARVIQAIGGGGIMPIATAYIGESFPEEKRGTALGLVGAIYGIATTLGPTIGSALLSVVGNGSWGYLFFINVPICIIVIGISAFIKESNIEKEHKKLDALGSIIISILILSLMYALTNLKFYDFTNSIKSTNVWPFFLIFIVLLPVFINTEKRAEDPILNLKYFTDRNIALTLLISFIVGCGLMGIVFLPQFGENVLKIKTGSGGYLVTLMAIFSGLAAPIGGKLIDKYSAKLILTIGFSSTIVGALTLALYTASNPGFIGLFIGLAFMGLGMGFTMGTPLNYLMQTYVSKGETASAQSTLSLVRSIGVAISPNILVGFIAEAGKQMPEKILGIMPKLTLPNIPGMPAQASNAINMSSGMGNIPKEMLDKLQAADISNIVDNVKEFTSKMVDNMIPTIKENIAKSMAGASGSMPKGAPSMNLDTLIANWKSDYINSIENIRSSIESVFQSTLNSGFAKLFIGAAVIAFIGLVFTILLNSKKKAS